MALGIKAARARKRVLFYSAEELINELAGAEVSHRISSFLDSLSRVDLLIIDELGYLNISKQSSALFFKLIAKRYEKTSTIITSNRPFENSNGTVWILLLKQSLGAYYEKIKKG